MLCLTLVVFGILTESHHCYRYVSCLVCLLHRTTYDSSSKQHWLCVYKGKLVGRFLLKDTNMNRPKSFSHLNEADHNIRRVVDEMVRKVSTI